MLLGLLLLLRLAGATIRCASVSFSKRVITATANGAHSDYALDVDGDGDVDALSGSYRDDTVAWYENDGSQSFDGDGDVDVLSASAKDDTVAWYESDGSQSFTERVITTLADYARSAFAIDVDGDGDVDVLSASASDDTVAWYEHDGSQSFTKHVITDSADYAISVFAIDVDGDGDVTAVDADRLLRAEVGRALELLATEPLARRHLCS